MSGVYKKSSIFSSSVDPLKNKIKHHPIRLALILITVSLIMVLWLVACSPGSAQPTQAPPATSVPQVEATTMDGAMLLETRCSVCHSADRPKSKTKTREEWDQTVSRMVGKGAKLTDAEKTFLVDYLATNYGQ